jgi:hypothetical protein
MRAGSPCGRWDARSTTRRASASSPTAAPLAIPRPSPPAHGRARLPLPPLRRQAGGSPAARPAGRRRHPVLARLGGPGARGGLEAADPRRPPALQPCSGLPVDTLDRPARLHGEQRGHRGPAHRAGGFDVGHREHGQQTLLDRVLGQVLLPLAGGPETITYDRSGPAPVTGSPRRAAAEITRWSPRQYRVGAGRHTVSAPPGWFDHAEATVMARSPVPFPVRLHVAGHELADRSSVRFLGADSV